MRKSCPLGQVFVRFFGHWTYFALDYQGRRLSSGAVACGWAQLRMRVNTVAITKRNRARLIVSSQPIPILTVG
jgi:hypothetical protein